MFACVSKVVDIIIVSVQTYQYYQSSSEIMTAKSLFKISKKFLHHQQKEKLSETDKESQVADPYKINKE